MHHIPSSQSRLLFLLFFSLKIMNSMIPKTQEIRGKCSWGHNVQVFLILASHFVSVVRNKNSLSWKQVRGPRRGGGNIHVVVLYAAWELSWTHATNSLTRDPPRRYHLPSPRLRENTARARLAAPFLWTLRCAAATRRSYQFFMRDATREPIKRFTYRSHLGLTPIFLSFNWYLFQLQNISS